MLTASLRLTLLQLDSMFPVILSFRLMSFVLQIQFPFADLSKPDLSYHLRMAIPFSQG